VWDGRAAQMAACRCWGAGDDGGPDVLDRSEGGAVSERWDLTAVTRPSRSAARYQTIITALANTFRVVAGGTSCVLGWVVDYFRVDRVINMGDGSSWVDFGWGAFTTLVCERFFKRQMPAGAYDFIAGPIPARFWWRRCGVAGENLVIRHLLWPLWRRC